jgi:alpha/beta superfamily hydrolase
MAEAIRIPIGEHDWLDALHQTPEGAKNNASERTLVIMLHGYPDGHKSSNNDLFGDLEHLLTKDGFDTVRFDFHGCGDSNGESDHFTFQTALRDYKVVLDWADKKGYRSFVVIAEGFGNCIGLMDLRRSIKCFVMLWPMLDPKNSWLKSYIEKAFGDNTGGNSVNVDGIKVGKEFLRQLNECDIGRYIKNIDIPILIQHGSKDENIPIEHLDVMREHVQSSRRVDITSYDSGEHGLQRLNERESMFFHIRQFLQKYT